MLNQLRRITITLLMIVSFIGCNNASPKTTPGDPSPIAGHTLFQSEPSIFPNPISRAPLIAIVEFQSTQPVTVTCTINDGERHWKQLADASRDHRIAILSMRPAREHAIEIQIQNADGSQSDTASLTFTTPDLPHDFPPLSIHASEPERMEPGITMFAVNLWENDLSILDYGYIIALDEHGEVVWYCRTNDRIADLRRLQNGNLLYQHGSYRFAYEIDVIGRDVRCWYGSNLTLPPNPGATAVAVDTLHHEIVELPSGNFLTLATELRHFDRFPINEFDASTAFESAEVVCDEVVEFQPDGTIVQRLHLTDLIDPTVFGFLSTGSFWKDKYDERISSPSRDWSHANGLIYLPDEDAIIVSLRHLDCLMKIDWQTKQICWMLGDPTGWSTAWQRYFLKPAGDLSWSYHQHGPQLTPRGTILMYDNGNYRTRPFGTITPATQNRSRVVEYAIDESRKTVEQIYEYRGEEDAPFYCPFYGEADWLPLTKNILITVGGHIELDDGTPSDLVPAEHQWARIFEVTRDAVPQVVFEVRCESPLGSNLGWSIYRASRFPSLQAGFHIPPPSSDEPMQIFERGRIAKVPK